MKARIGEVTHGASRTKTYKSYHSMMARCYDENHRSYKYYGGRDENPIVVCDRWHDLETFLEDAKELPGYMVDGCTSLDRIDVNKGYSPENCRWVSKLQQQRNKRNNVFVEWKGQRVTLSELAEMENIGYQVFTGAYYANKDKKGLEYAVQRAKHNQERVNIAQIARDENIPYNKLYHLYVTKKESLDRAICICKS